MIVVNQPDKYCRTQPNNYNITITHIKILGSEAPPACGGVRWSGTCILMMQSTYQILPGKLGSQNLIIY